MAVLGIDTSRLLVFVFGLVEIPLLAVSNVLNQDEQDHAEGKVEVDGVVGRFDGRRAEVRRVQKDVRRAGDEAK